MPGIAIFSFRFNKKDFIVSCVSLGFCLKEYDVIRLSAICTQEIMFSCTCTAQIHAGVYKDFALQFMLGSIFCTTIHAGVYIYFALQFIPPPPIFQSHICIPPPPLRNVLCARP